MDSYSTREEAYFIEQAVLRETLNYFDCPIELIPTNDNEGMIGWTEVRKMKFEELEKIIDFYKEEMESLGKWEFAASYVPMTSAQRQECINRSN